MARCRCMDCDINRMAFAVRIKREFLELERELGMGRLSDKLKQAGGVVIRQTAKIEARADAILERETSIEAMTDQAFSPHEAILSEAEKGLQDVESALRLLGNGGPPLEPSSASPAAPTAAEAATQPDPVAVAPVPPPAPPVIVSPEVEQPAATFQPAGTL